MDVREATIKVGEVNVRLCRSGRGRPLLYLHGASGPTPELPFFAALARHVELLMPEHPGFGTSENPASLRSIGDYALHYLEFIETLGLRDLYVVGSSLGGWLAAEMAIRDRSRLAGATLIAPAGLKVKGLRPGDTFIWNPEESIRNLFHDQGFAERMLAAEADETGLDQRIANRYATTKLAWQPRWVDPDLFKWLYRIRMPVQLIWGASDKVFPVAYADHWRAQLPQARLHVIAQCGHLPQIEHADTVADLVLKALSEVAP